MSETGPSLRYLWKNLYKPLFYTSTTKCLGLPGTSIHQLHYITHTHTLKHTHTQTHTHTHMHTYTHTHTYTNTHTNLSITRNCNAGGNEFYYGLLFHSNQCCSLAIVNFSIVNICVCSCHLILNFVNSNYDFYHNCKLLHSI